MHLPAFLNRLGLLQRLTLGMAVLVVIAGISLLALKPSASDSHHRGLGSLGGDFTLSGIDGPASLHDYHDRVVVMMFGFTSCPDICPTGLANVSAALGYLDDDQLRRVQPLFISVDPQRDTVERLDKYVRYFHPQMRGVTGAKADIDAVVSAYGAVYQIIPLTDSELQYSVDHSSRLYLIDPQGQLATLLYHNTPPEQVADAIKALL